MKYTFALMALILTLPFLAHKSATAGTNVGRINVTATLKESNQPAPGLNTYRLALADMTSKVIGYQTLTCFALSRFSTLRQCSSVISLPKGKIVLLGTLVNLGSFSLVVAGGDGIYVDARGSERESIDGAVNRWSVVVSLA